MKKQSVAAAKIVVLENSAPIIAELEQVQERIRRRAFEISLRGGNAGTEVENWLSAESEIIAVPPVELAERDGTYVVQLAIAGVNPEDLCVMATPRDLLIKAELHHNHGENGVIVHQCDFKPAVAFRSLTFPEPINPKTLKLESNAGVFRISAGKQTAAPLTEAAGVENRVSRPRRAESRTKTMKAS